MDAKIGQFFDSVGSFFSGSDKIPWCDGVANEITKCLRTFRPLYFVFYLAISAEIYEIGRKVRDAGSEEVKKKCLMRLPWALVHSRQTEDVQREIAMLEDGVIGIGITATAFGALGFIAGAFVAALARKK